MTRPRRRGRPSTAGRSALVPAAAQHAEPSAVVLEGLNAEAVDLFAKAVGGRDQLAATLAVSGTGSAIDKITTLLLDPRYAQWSLARLCLTAQVSVAELFAAYRKALLVRAHLHATHIIAARLPPIVEDVMRRAAPVAVVCPTCAGAASGEGSCPTCGGSGSVWTEPELDRQKLALELGQLLEKKGGLIVQQNNTATVAAVNATGGGALEQLQQAVSGVLFGGSPVVDIEPSPVGDPPAELPPIEDDPEPDVPGGEPEPEPPSTIS